MGAVALSVAEHPWAWLAIVGLGAYHGLNPAMGWLFAVSNGMQQRRWQAVFLALPPIALGHFFAMAAALLPFALLQIYLQRLDDVRAAAGLLLVLLGVYQLARRRHPRFLARIKPTRLTLWSFLMATAHGAGLMLVPAVLGLCASAAPHTHALPPPGAGSEITLSVVAAGVHTAALLLTAGALAWVVFRLLGLRLLRQSWVNFELLWGALLVVVGAIALALAVQERAA